MLVIKSVVWKQATLPKNSDRVGLFTDETWETECSL